MGTVSSPPAPSWTWTDLLTPLSLRGGCVSCYAGKKTLLQKTGPCGRTSPWSEGSSASPSQNAMPSTNRRAMRCITTATGHRTSSTCPPSRFRFVHLGHCSKARGKKTLKRGRERGISLLSASLNIGFWARDDDTLPSQLGAREDLGFPTRVLCSFMLPPLPGIRNPLPLFFGKPVFIRTMWELNLFCHIESDSRSVVSNSLRPHRLYSPWNSPGRNTGVGSLSLLQWIFLT